MEKASASWMVGAWRALICVGLDAEAVLERNWRGGARVARGVLAGRTTHLPAGPPTSQQVPCSWTRLPWVQLGLRLGLEC